jgi:uncharacterized C2H2 Zn-finger protein
MAVEKSAGFVFVKCAQCLKFFQVERDFWEPKFQSVPLRCPHCFLEFPKEKPAKLVGL